MLNKELYSEGVEQSILGCVLVFEDSRRYLQRLEEDDFALVKNKEVFGLIKELYEENKPITIITVKELAKSKNLNSKDVMLYLVEIQDKVITSANIEYYINQLKNYSIRRKMVEKSKEIISQMYEINTDIEADEIKKNMVQLITSIKAETIEKKECEMKDVMAETMEDIENKYRKRDDLRYMTGFFDLDKVTNGLHEQELTLIAARPGCGKTALALNIAENVARKGIYTYFVSLEMSKKQLGSRLITSKSGIDSHRIRSGWLEEQDWVKMVQVAGELSEMDMVIDDKSATIQEIELMASELKESKNIGLIVIDYLQLLNSKNKYAIREQEVAEISRKLKLLSKDLDIPIIALCQLNRESLKRSRPTNADLRESGSLEQDADNIMFIYADEDQLQNKVVDTEIIISKQRNGPTGTIKLRFDKKTMTFKNIV